MGAPSRITERNRLLKLIAGVQAHLASMPSIVLSDGTSYTPGQIVALLEQRLQALDAVAVARAKARDAVVANKQNRQSFEPLLRSLRAAVIGMFGASTELLNDFGLAPRAVRKTDVETKAQALEKLRATREARHTMGKRQKENVVGQAPPAAAPPAANGAANGASSSASQGSANGALSGGAGGP